VSITCNSFQYEHIQGSSIDKEIIAYANTFFFEDFSLNIILDHEEIVDEFVPAMDIDISDNNNLKIKFHKIENLSNYII